MAGHLEAPRAPRRPTVLKHDGDERTDDWHWLRERDDPAVLEYLNAENAFTESSLSHLDPQRGRIFEEIKARVQETDVSAPASWGSWEYYARTIEGREYAVHCRRPRGADALPDPTAPPGSSPGEEVLIDENALADGEAYFALRGYSISPSQSLLAYSTDTTGGERATLRFRDLGEHVDLSDEITDVYYGLAWCNDNRTILYVRPDDAMRPHQVWRHVLGTPASDDVLVLEESDERYYVGIGRTRTGRYIVISTGSKVTTEVRLVDADNPTAEPRLVAAREDGIEYDVEHHESPEHGSRLFVLTNADGAKNFKLMVAPDTMPARDTWIEVIAHRDDVRLVDIDAFAGHLVVTERADALERIRVLGLSDGDDHIVSMPDEVYAAWVGLNREYATTTLRLGYTSLTAPVTDLDYEVDARRSTVVKRQPVRGYDADLYESHRLWATAPDGEQVPISILHRHDLALDGTAPLFLYGYGSYELSVDPTFSVSRLSLLERGMVYAIAHVRGGGEKGRRWYDDGKLDHKRNTFTDFIACAEHLVSAGYTTPDRLVARGASAGGLLMGAITNFRPDLFRVIIAEVPFVDCLTTMLDGSLPLTITEWDEWGDPATDPAIYSYMKSYSPYDNVAATTYPAILATAGLNDPRVQYWEPAKWVAKLRVTATGDAPLFLKTELGAGHHGPSGRYETWKDEAFVLSFALDQVGITQ